MQVSGTGAKAWLLRSALLLVSIPFAANQAYADQDLQQAKIAPKPIAQPHLAAAARLPARSARVPLTSQAAEKRMSRNISCVPYAREISGIDVAGNAWQWWHNAVGTYARGDRPEVGSVLNFRSNGRMPLGHVAVVTRIVNAREILIDHANWPNEGRSGIWHNIAVVDVSEANNWSAVRVQLGRPDMFGSVYPTYGFIYKRPDTGVVTASITRPAPQPDINPITSDLRPVAERSWHMVEEVAESPAEQVHRVEFHPDAR